MIRNILVRATAVLALAVLALPSRADILLTLTRTGVPNEVQLDWTAGFAPYDIYKGVTPQDAAFLVNTPVNVGAATRYLSTDIGPLTCYVVACTTGPACPPPGAEDCVDGWDNDVDGVIDCADTDCAADPACVSNCGNGAIDGAEQCDDGNVRAGDGCSPTCTNEVVPACGDAILQRGETCDQGSGNSDTVQGACRTTCQPAGCGDSVVDYVLGEECDDGNLAPGDRCDATCRVEAPATCGDGTLDLALGEECDDGGTSPGDGCSPACQLELVGATCGDGTPDPLEVCDDSNLLNGDACNPTCNLANVSSLFAGMPGVAALVDGVGTAARFQGVGTMTADDRYLWMAAGGNVIRRVEIATADVVTVAGDAAGGTAGYVDDPSGLNARFSGPDAIATDGVTVWIADGANHRIRAMSVAPPHAVTTVAGSGAIAHTDGNGTAAAFDGLRGLTYFNGFVYLLDASSATLRRFDPATGDVVTLAGTPYATGTADGLGAAARFTSPRYMTSDNSGMLYVADTNGATIRAYNTITGYVSTFAGTGTAGYLDGIGTAALIHRPRGMTSDGSSIYWTEANQHTIRQGIRATSDVSTLLGTHCGGGMPCAGGYAEGVGTAALLNVPFGLAFHFPSNSLFVFDSGNNVLRRIR